MRHVVDLSQRIREGLVTYPGHPAVEFSPFLTREASRAHYAAGTEFALDTITMIGNTGTYLDSPFHRYEGGADLAGLALETLVDLPTEVVRLPTDVVGPSRGISAAHLEGRDVAGKAVLLHTGWDIHFGTPSYGNPAPFLTADGVEWLVGHGAVLVGIDSVNIDDAHAGGERPAHSGLLAAGVHVVEHLTNLGALPDSGARFFVAPPAVEGFGTFPVRAFALLAE